MSRAQIDKLNTLLSRVRERRAEARLVQLPGASTLSSANTNLAQPQRPPLSEARPGSAAEPQPEAGAPSRRTSSIQPAISDADAAAQRSEPPVQLKTPTSTVPPPSMPTEPASMPDAAAQRGSVEAAPPAPQRIAPSSALPFDAAVKVVSAPRIEAPKTFGELLELSLALRPK